MEIIGPVGSIPMHFRHFLSDRLSNVNYDIDFAVPFRHRVRFTQDLAGDEFQVLLDLFEPTADGLPNKVLVIADSAMANVLVTSAEGEKDAQKPYLWLNSFTRKLQSQTELRLLDCSEFNRHNETDKTEEGNGAALDSVALQIDGGESCKNDRSQVERILGLINHFEIDRRSYIVAIGGGAVLDAVGYAAAIAHRGVRLIRIPTTTLAQDDSGVGVKNAINYFRKKNWVGTFSVPWGVINDAKVLESLSDRDFCCGFSEAVKVSLLKSSTDFDFLYKNAAAIRQRKMEVAFEAIKRSCVWHLKHITQGGDPFESLEARPLDFGHWSAHRMESLTSYRIRHGEAVGIGVAIDCLYSKRMFDLSEDDAQRVISCLSELGIDLWDPVLDDPDCLLQGLEEFRQHLGGRLTVTMLQSIGRPIDVHQIDTSEMKLAIAELKQCRANLKPAVTR